MLTASVCAVTPASQTGNPHVKKLLAALSLLAVVAALMLVKPSGIVAQPNRSDLEERVARLEVEGTINRGHIQSLETKVRELESSSGDRKGNDQESTVIWLTHAMASNSADVDSLDKRVHRLEYNQVVELLCAKRSAKERAQSADRGTSDECWAFDIKQGRSQPRPK